MIYIFFPSRNFPLPKKEKPWRSIEIQNQLIEKIRGILPKFQSFPDGALADPDI
jgi:hypothetical protein